MISACAALRHRTSTWHCPALCIELCILDRNFLSGEFGLLFTAIYLLVNKKPNIRNLMLKLFIVLTETETYSLGPFRIFLRITL